MASNRKTSRKPRNQNWATPVARQQHSKVRRQLARAAAERSIAEAAHAREALRNAEDRMEQTEINKRVNSIANGLRPRLLAVMNSWGLTLPVEIVAGRGLSAWTDFTQIHISYNTDKASKASEARINKVSVHDLPMRVEDQRRIAAEIRACFYHEVGHNLATVPLPELLALAARNGWSSSTDGVIAIDVTDPASWSFPPSFQSCWNALEDQRMEAWLVSESPQIAAYLTVLILERIAAPSNVRGSWPLVAGRKYLPPRVRAASRASFIHPTISAERIERIVDTYRRATTAVEMVLAVEEYASLMSDLSGEGYNPIDTIDSHRPGRKPGGEASDERIRETGDQISENEDGSDEDSDEEETGGNGSEGNPGGKPGPKGEPGGDEDDDEGEDSDFDGDDEDDARGGRGAGTGHSLRTGDERPADPRTETLDALDDVLNELADDQTLADDVASINEAYDTDEGALPNYSDQYENTNEEVVAQAHTIVEEIVRAFQLVTADCEPVWQSQQRRGVLEAVRYRTRQPGDLEIFRSFSDHGDPGHDIAVSLFLDISGSMSGTDDVLGGTAWAVKTACDSIGIDCDVTLFDHMGYTLWGINDTPTHIPSLAARGGTHPTGAFSAILSDQRPNKHHIVLVMTDGAWTEPTSLVPFLHPNVYSMLFYYAPFRYGTTGPDPIMANRHRVNEAYNIDDLTAIPQALEHLLMTLV